MQHERRVLKTRVFASGYNYTRLEPLHHDRAYSTTDGNCVVTTAQLDIFMMQSYHQGHS